MNKLVVVVVETLLGDVYIFPGVLLDELKRVLPQSGRIPEGQSTLVLTNSAPATLVMPLRSVKTICYKVDEESLDELWHSPVPTVEET
jgi:hypothetical protein